MSDDRYDNGGDLPAGSVSIRNETGKPERVLTAEQWQRLTALIHPPE